MPLRRKLRELYQSWQWILIVACDNFLRRRLGHPPLINWWFRIQRPWRPSEVLRHRDLHLRGSEVDESLPGSGEKIEHYRNTHLWMHFPSSNIALAMRSAMAIHQCVSQLKLEAKNTGLILAEHFDVKVQPLLSHFASVRSVKSLKNRNHCFAELIKPSPPPDTKWIIGNRDLAEDFRLHVLKGAGLTPALPCTELRRVTLISRQPYPERINRAPLLRVIDNEEELLEGLQARFPHMQISHIRLEQHSIERQLAIVNETDALVGMHGAGMSFSTLLPANAAVLEIFPCHFRQNHQFSTFYITSVVRNLHYRRWLQLLPWRTRTSKKYAAFLASLDEIKPWTEPRKDMTTVSVRAVASRLRSLEHDLAAAAKKLSAKAQAQA